MHYKPYGQNAKYFLYNSERCVFSCFVYLISFTKQRTIAQEWKRMKVVSSVNGNVLAFRNMRQKANCVRMRPRMEQMYRPNSSKYCFLGRRALKWFLRFFSYSFPLTRLLAGRHHVYPNRKIGFRSTRWNCLFEFELNPFCFDRKKTSAAVRLPCCWVRRTPFLPLHVEIARSN